MIPKYRELYEEMADIPVFDLFARPSFEGTQITNPAQLLIDKRNSRYLMLASGITPSEYEKMSHYERFECFMANLDNMLGSGVREEFLTGLELYFSKSESELSIGAKALWCELCDKIEREMCDGKSPLSIPRAECCETPTLPVLSMGVPYAAMIAENLDILSKCGECGYAALDLSGVSFQRTDRYHAQTAYEDILRGRDKRMDEVISGILYPIFEAASKKGITLYIYVGDEILSAKAMIEYFAGRGILPDIRIFANREGELVVAKELCGVYESGEREARVLLGMLYLEGDTVNSICERVLALSGIYPIGSLIVGGSITKGRAEIRHEILKKGICKALSYLSSDIELQKNIVKKILLNR